MLQQNQQKQIRQIKDNILIRRVRLAFQDEESELLFNFWQN